MRGKGADWGEGGRLAFTSNTVETRVQPDNVIVWTSILGPAPPVRTVNASQNIVKNGLAVGAVGTGADATGRGASGGGLETGVGTRGGKCSGAGIELCCSGSACGPTSNSVSLSRMPHALSRASSFSARPFCLAG